MTATKMNTLLRGELAATETYQQAIAAVPVRMADKLRAIRQDHRAAANSLRECAHHLGVKPTRRSGVFGMVAKAIEGTATFLGDYAALQSLKAGEEHGIRTYDRALRKDCPAECESLIRGTLLPQTREHVAALDRLLHEV